MSKYVVQMDKKINDFSLENEHFKPLFIAEYLTEKIK